MVKDKVPVKNGDILVEFSYNDSLDNYLTSTNLDPLEDDEHNSLDIYSTGTNSIKLLAPEGDIIDIKVYVNNKNSADKSLINYHEKLVKEQHAVIGKLASHIQDKNKQISATDNMNLSFMNIGNNKFKGSIFVGTRIVYFIKRPKELNIGDKIMSPFNSNIVKINSVNSVKLRPFKDEDNTEPSFYVLRERI